MFSKQVKNATNLSQCHKGKQFLIQVIPLWGFVYFEIGKNCFEAIKVEMLKPFPYSVIAAKKTNLCISQGTGTTCAEALAGLCHQT